MDKNSSTPQRRKIDSVVKDGSNISQPVTRIRQKRGSNSQTPISSYFDCSEELIQCNVSSTSANQTPISRSVSSLSSSEPVHSTGQRRSSRLSQMESQQLMQTPEKKKKKKGDEAKISGKDKKTSKLLEIEENGVKPFANKRTSGMSKKENEKCMKNEKEENEEEEPTEKRARRASRRSVTKKVVKQDKNNQDEQQVDNECIMVRNCAVASPKLSRKLFSKRQTLHESSLPISEQQNIERITNTVNEDCEKPEQTLKVSKRKKTSASALFSPVEHTSISEEFAKLDDGESARNSKMSKSEARFQADLKIKTDDETDACLQENKSVDLERTKVRNEVVSANESLDSLQSDRKIQKTKIREALSETPKPLKEEKVSKENLSPTLNSVSPSKEDLVHEYNRSISEKISLLKPKAFVGRTSGSFRKPVDEQGDGSGQEVDSDAESRRAIMESAQRRIEQNLSTSESDSRLFRGIHAPVAHSSKNDSSESESAPEAVSFNNARQDAIETIKSAAEHVKREKQRLKERRKARLEMLKQQKEEKLIRLKEKMASQEDASCSSSEESGYEEEIRNARQKLKKKKAKSKAQRTEKENVDDAVGHATPKPPSAAASDDSSDDDGVTKKDAAALGSLKRVQTEMIQAAADIVNAKLHKVGNSSNNRALQEDKLRKKKNKLGQMDDSEKKDRGFKNLTSLDYIPLSTEGATKFMVVPLDKAMRTSKSLAEEAADFRQNMLFGSRIKREPTKVVSAYQQKLVASGKNFHVR